ncbi:hypothetical protein CBI38_18005 [Rhodococcus oxybenzonivorans]|uniref:Uncharacterized protein n=1 Tax=Rhodococcus oxybenzonivorans TaxID=1990687 RepID=A0A2S2BX76_9NOCA|nr:hypothetical protein [Rhodococcus oxybenzonivorans]AWK73169.1 hypothetical protein CBI38_18005 [Rhodococcus oxybenzonivorans]
MNAPDGRHAAARAAVALVGLAFLEEDRAAMVETLEAAERDGVALEVALAAAEAYAGTLESLLGSDKARAVLERALEAAELDLTMAAPSAPAPRSSPGESGIVPG